MTTERTLTPTQAISRLRNTNNFNNATFIQNQIGEGKLDQSMLNSAAPGIIRIAGGRTRTGITALGTGADLSKAYTVNTRPRTFVPRADFDPALITSSGSILSHGISVGTFSGCENETVPFESNQVLASNLYIQSEILGSTRARKEFSGYSINCEEGIYNYEGIETKTEGDLADLSSKGQAIAYNVSLNGTRRLFMTFRMAEYLLDSPFYDKLILDYHTYAGELAVRLFVVVPDASGGYEGLSFLRATETRFNGVTQSNSLLLLRS